MKDIVIRGKTLRRELWIALACLSAGMLVNVGAILAYHRPWTELVTQIGYVAALALGLYLLLGLIRVLVGLILMFIRKKQ